MQKMRTRYVTFYTDNLGRSQSIIAFDDTRLRERGRVRRSERNLHAAKEVYKSWSLN